MKTTKEMIEVMKAYEEGKELQYKALGTETWLDTEDPSWCWDRGDYRIKPKEPTYRPYESTDELIADYKARFNVDNPSYTMPLIWIKKRDVSSHKGRLINSFEEDGVRINANLFDMKGLFECYTYLDGTPCGKLVEE